MPADHDSALPLHAISAMTPEIVAAALLLRRWADERNLRVFWHIAGIGDVEHTAKLSTIERRVAREALAQLLAGENDLSDAEHAAGESALGKLMYSR